MEKAKYQQGDWTILTITDNGITIPARPVLEMTIKHAADEMFDEVLNTSVEGILSGWTQTDVEKELKKMCMRMETHARKIIYNNDGRLAPNAPSVAAKKKGNHPLFDTGQWPLQDHQMEDY